MTKKQQPDQLAVTRHTDTGYVVPVSRSYPLTKAERRSAIETRKQAQAMGQERMKTLLAHRAIADIDYSSVSSFMTTASGNILTTCTRRADRKRYCHW